MRDRERAGLMTSLLASRPMCAALSGAAVLHVGLEIAGLRGWPCPVLSALRIPCPGCGLGRACAALVRGEVATALALHAFAPLAMGAMAILTVGACHEGLRQRFRAVCGRVEERFPLAPVVLAALLIYWLGRLWLDAGGLPR